jgi:outer membrane immunogenic protein
MRPVTSLIFAFTIMIATCAAHAADFPPWQTYQRPIPTEPWSGFYFGVNGGVAFAHAKASGSYGGFSASGSQDIPGGILGAQLGYNWQVGNFVYGIEGDIQYSSQERDVECTAIVCAGFDVKLTNKLPWFATARGRVGYGIERYLVYATGGLAYTQLSSTLSASAGGAPIGSISWSEARAAWTVGGGVEFAVSPGWSAKLEYLYVDTGSFDASVNVPLMGTLTPTIHVTDQIVRAGINYHF